MKRQYWFIIIAYIMMQLSSIAGVPLLLSLGVGAHSGNAAEAASGYWAVISFTLTFFSFSFGCGTI